MSVTLYAYWRSSASWRVRIGLHLKGVPHRIEPVHLVRDGGEQHGEAHRARNPMAQVPVLAVPDGAGGVHLLTQSMAILDWLDATWPTPALYPADPWERARAIELAEIVNAGTQPLQNLGILQAIEGLGGDKLAWGRDVIAKGLAAVQARAQGASGAFLVGDAVSVADLCLVPQLYNARRFGVDLQPLSALVEIEARCAEIPAFKAAHPDLQPDAQV